MERKLYFGRLVIPCRLSGQFVKYSKTPTWEEALQFFDDHEYALHTGDLSDCEVADLDHIEIGDIRRGRCSKRFEVDVRLVYNNVVLRTSEDELWRIFAHFGVTLEGVDKTKTPQAYALFYLCGLPAMGHFYACNAIEDYVLEDSK